MKMNRAIPFLLALALAGGTALAHDTTGHKHGQEPHQTADAHAHHHHGKLDVAAAQAPRIARLNVVEDAVGGFNLLLEVENFTFAPDLVNQDHKPGHGHAHLYVDGVKLARLYGTAYHIAALEPGTHEIVVTLNANDHRELAVDGETIAATATVTVRGDQG